MSNLNAALAFFAITPENLAPLIRRFREVGLSRFFIGGVDAIWETEDPASHLAWLHTVIGRVRDSGIEPAIWCSGLGYGPPRSPKFRRMFPNLLTITGFSGNRNDAICVLDKNFRKAYLSWIAAYARSGAGLLMIDDDFVLSARNVFGCACAEHLKLLGERAGHEVTHEDLRKAFSGKPNDLRNLFLQVQGETVLDFCRDIRAAANAVSPDFRIGLAASYTHFDIEGVDIKEMISILAGKNRPLLRLSGATYWTLRASRLHPGRQSLGAIQETIRSQRVYFDGFDVELLDENDCHPRDHRIVPASLVQLYDRISIADGIEIRFKYMFQYLFCPPLTHTGSAYQRAHMRDMAWDDSLSEIFHGGYAAGWHVKQVQQVMRTAVLPEDFAGDEKLMSWGTQSRAGAFLVSNCQSTTYVPDGDGPVAAFWENARHLTPEELDRGVLLDITAARILAEKGIDVGLRKVEAAGSPSEETFCDTGTTYRNLWEEQGKFYKVTVDPRAEISSMFRSGDDEFPACYFYTASDGRRFAVYTFDSNTLHYTPYLRFGAVLSPGRREQLNTLYGKLSGRKAPIRTCDDISQDFYILAKRNGRGNLAVLFCNIFPDTADFLEFRLSVPGKILKKVHGEAEIQGDLLKVADIPPYDWCAFEIADN